jgi:hypothetical protein
MNKQTKLILGISAALLTNTAQATTLDFNGSFDIIDPAGSSVFIYTSYTGTIDFDTSTNTGSVNFDPEMFKGWDIAVRDVALTQTETGIHAEGFWDWGVNVNQAIEWDWMLQALPGGATSLTLLDTDGDGTPGTALTSGPFPGFTMAIEGIATLAPVPVPVPAAMWLFGSGLLGLFGVAKRRNRV